MAFAHLAWSCSTSASVMGASETKSGMDFLLFFRLALETSAAVTALVTTEGRTSARLPKEGATNASADAMSAPTTTERSAVEEED